MTGITTPSEPRPEAPAGPRLKLDLAAVREKLRNARGPAYWRGLEELADDAEFHAFLGREFPRHTSDWDESLEKGFDRRTFLHLGMASLGLAGLTACTRQPIERIVPYVRQPEEILLGVPNFYATALTLGGYAMGLLAESHEGRPTKVEGNPEHPASLGGASAVAQATILNLYDPDRSQMITKLGDTQIWKNLVEALLAAAESQKMTGGAGIRILTEETGSPVLRAQIAAVLAKYPAAKWITWDPLARASAAAGATLAFGQPTEARYDLSKANVVVSLDADFLTQGPWAIRHAKDFSARRKPAAGMVRLYAAESTPAPTGTVADHRISVRPSALPALTLALGSALGVAGFPKQAGLDLKTSAWVAAAARDLKAQAGSAVVIPGDFAPAAVHAACHAINEALGATGKTVVLTEPAVVAPQADAAASLKELVKEIDAKDVDVLLILGGNPVFSAPADVDLATALLKVPFRLHLGSYADETSMFCPWHVPEAHFLETWGDARALDGTVSIQQPLIEPLYEGKSAIEVLSVLLDETPMNAHDIVKGYWLKQRPGPDFETFWRKSLHDGVVAGTAFAPRSAGPKPEGVAKAIAELAAAKAGVAGALEVSFRPDPSILDGRFANNGWLQELPKPLSKLTWDNAAVVSPATAQRLGLQPEDLVTVTANGKSIDLPVLVQPGQAADVVTVHFGFGRTRAGRVGNGVGANAYALRTSNAAWTAGVELKKTGRQQLMSHTQQHFRMEGRELIRAASLATFTKDPDFAKKLGDLPGREESLYPAFEYKARAWGLSVDLSTCTGCNACVIACQAENNIPIVGKEQVRRNREMQWIRIDQYYVGDDIDAPAEVRHQPVMCQHCENAPCEVVCPVAATVHGAEGLNEMAYNRCVGTRYCSNNCPYHVRRFNFFEYNGDIAPVAKMGKNPEVTVRSRGVMEKCTFCIQRINRARIAAERDGRPVKDGEVVTACQQTCPSDAIVFGDINDPLSAIAREKKDPRTYWLLEELNTRPRTSYQARVRNPNAELEAV